PPVEITDRSLLKPIKEWKSGGITAVGVMKKYGIKRSSFYKLAKQYEETKHKNLLND
ncbi:integrase, partial [Bacillus cereus]